MKKKTKDDRNNFLGHVFLVTTFLVAIGSTIFKYGIYILLPQHMKMLRLPDAETDSLIMSHTFLHVGGPHRGGTTFLWNLLKQHPNISGNFK